MSAPIQYPSRLIISKKALWHNVQAYKSWLQPGTRLMLMIKAAGYGTNDTGLAKLLEEQGLVDHLGVAYFNEGVALRETGIKLPVMVMNPAGQAAADFVDHNLEYTLHCPEQLPELSALPLTTRQQLVVHLKFDTGMHRLGFAPAQATELADTIKKLQLHITGVYTHLASSPEPAHDDFTQRQVALFDEAYTALSKNLGYRPWRHVLNSAGIVRFPQYQYEMVRAGMGIYGLDPAGERQAELQPIARLVTRISQINTLNKGETVGYVRMGKITHNNTRVAVLPVGYADGYKRLYSNGRARVWLNGQQAPVIGNVCMDMTFVDVTGIDCRVGDEVELFGPHIDIRKLAASAHTIDYEILTSTGPRVQRVFE